MTLLIIEIDEQMIETTLMNVSQKLAEGKSVKTLRDLKPSLVIPGHGEPMKGEELKNHLDKLAKDFKEIAVPDQGVFVKEN